MPLSTTPVAGLIRIEPLPLADHSNRLQHDDSTLDLLLEAFAHSEGLLPPDAAEERCVRLLASGRLSRLRFADRGIVVNVRANLGQLLTDLQAEYDQLALPG